MKNNKIVEQLRQYFDKVIADLEGADNELYYRLVAVDGAYVLSTFWIDRSWLRVMEVFQIPQDADFSEVLEKYGAEGYPDDPFEPFSKWRVRSLL